MSQQHPRGGAASNRMREDALRQRLLVELSVLREQYEALTGIPCALPALQEAADIGAALVRNSAVGADRRDSDFSEDALDQDDRDAIEAFFNNSEDDFVRLFNNGQGHIQRSDVLRE